MRTRHRSSGDETRCDRSDSESRLKRTNSSTSDGSGYALAVHPSQVAAGLKEAFETRSDDTDNFTFTDFFTENASFQNTILHISENTGVILLMYKFLHIISADISYEVLSAFGSNLDLVLIEAEVRYKWKRPLSWFVKPWSFHVYHNAKIVEDMGRLEDPPVWHCVSLEEVWDFGYHVKLGAHFITKPFVRLAAFACMLFDYVLLILAVLKSLSF
ncbi:hypothetical protein DIPPA_10559 [Diplonema papillatum]|nr:hypothetical protein DIPPA_10559 [Diplonema papillatum]|eukprot:gene2855-4479_t